MNYNNFTIQYIQTLQENLHIVVDKNENVLFNRASVTLNNIKKLIEDLQIIWKKSNSSIEILKRKEDSKIQSGLFGLHEDLDFAIKTGFLISDRVVLIDYLYDRILKKQNPESINIRQIIEIAIPLVKLLPLAKNGRIVIIPNPFSWNKDSKKMIKEVAERTSLSSSLLGMLNMLSICKSCNLHPYTLANSDEQYKRILNTEVNHVDMIGKDAGKYAYEGILGSLISQRVLNETSFSYSKGIPMEKYVEIISKHEDFYKDYLIAITAGGSMNGTENIKSIQNSIDKVLNNYSQSIGETINGLGKTSDILGASLALAAVTIPTLPASVGITGGGLILAGILGGTFKGKTNTENTIVSLFKDLNKESKKYSR